MDRLHFAQMMMFDHAHKNSRNQAHDRSLIEYIRWRRNFMS